MRLLQTALAFAAASLLCLGFNAFAGERIVSLAPSVTETLFAIGAGSEIVGVTRYCAYPEEVKALPKAGGFLDPDFEAILRLKPTLVAMTSDNPKSEARLKALGIRCVAVDNGDVEEILKSFVILGEATGHLKEAQALAASSREKVEELKAKAAGLPRPKVLLCLGRSLGGGVKEVFAAGRSAGVYGDLIAIAGGENVCAKTPSKAPALSAEGVIRLNPEVVIDLAPPGADAKAMLADWASLKQVDAVRNSRVHVLSSGYSQIPGPRFLLTLADLLKLIHPELEGSLK